MNNEQQKSILEHAVAVFGTVALDPNERAARFLEESLECVQAVGLSKDSAQRLLDYVYSRPVGEVRQELGGCILTLQALAEASGQSLAMCEILETARFFHIDPAEFRAKQARKHKAGVAELPKNG